MLNDIKKIIQTDRRLQFLLLGSLIVQLIVCINQPGFYHPDQHFQIIEFSSYQLHKASGASHVWEMNDFVRSTLQVYVFSAYRIICEHIGITDPYTQMTLLRIKLGLACFLLFNLISIYYFKDEKRNVLYFVLLILNFSWILPYTRTLFSSEIMSSVFFFGALFLYDINKEKRNAFFLFSLVGFLFCLAFYFRFQFGFALVGFGIWLIFFEKKYARLLPLAAGFIIGFIINTYLDKEFYHQLVFTPYHYFHVNISEGRAASFGTSSFLNYIGLLVAVITTPPFSIVLIIYGLIAIFKKYNHPIIITVVFFIVGHCLIGHKEERFLFPVFNLLPIVVGFGIPFLINYLNHCKKWIAWFIKTIMYISICLNIVLLGFFMFVPYSQTVAFSSQFKKEFNHQPATIYCLSRTPFETESGLPLTFYQNSFPELELKKVLNNDSVKNITGSNIYVATTFNQTKKNLSMFDSLGYKPVLYSSKILWNLNEYLLSKKINTINDIWVLYKKEN